MTIDDLLKYCGQMIDQIDHAKGNSSELRDAKALAFAGMLGYYQGEWSLDDIYLAFLETDFICLDEPISKMISRKYSLSKKSVDALCSHEEGSFYEVSGYKNDRTKKTKIKRCIYIDKELLDKPEVLVERIVHQMNHVLNSRKNSICSKQGKLAARMGVSLDYFVTRKNESLALEEAINGLQVEDIMKIVSGYSKYVTDSRYLEIIKKVSEQSKKEDDVMTALVRPLYEDEEFRSVLVDRRLSGRLSGIREAFDEKTEVGAYNSLLACCDVIGSTDVTSEKSDICHEQAKALIKKYIETPKVS